MTELLTAAQMRAIERAAIDSGEVTGLELMERAGRGVVEAIFEEWPELAMTDQRAVVLCGPGNNGGDGFVVARLLKEWGWAVEVFLYGDAGKLPPDAKANYGRWGEMGEVRPISGDTAEEVQDKTCETMFIDALFGTGLSKPLPKLLSDLAYELLTEFSDQGVAIDMPSGICSDSGRNLSERPSFVSALTVTFQNEKLGHRLAIDWWRKKAPSIVDLEIGCFKPISSEFATHVDRWTALDLADPYYGKLAENHKYDHGHALIISGGSGKGGAARLAARGALRIGAGLVTVGCPPEALAENAARLDAIMVRAIGGAEALAEVLKDARINALCLGPGLGADERGVALVAAALASPSHPSPAGEGSRKRVGEALPLSAPERGEGRGGPALVLDADALTILAGDAGLFAALHEDCVLTPHGGEFARLFPDIAEKLNAPATKGPAYSKVDATREAAARAGCVVLFKGADTVIADADGRCSINSAHYERAAPWLATAGSGDVLAGFITGLLARGFVPMQAAETAAWLHVECALKFGPGLIAEDLPEQLPAVFRDLGV
ncbi:MAG: NAD(P)H-hydrate epimerase [Paracoccaceae bacterium]